VIAMNRIIAILSLLLLAGCATPRGGYDDVETAMEAPVYVEPPPPPTEGAIYPVGTDLRLFEDLRARRAGDILTIRLVERTDASKQASTSTSKGSNMELADPVIFGRPVTINGTPVLNNSYDAQRTFNGEGDSTQSNRLTGNVTVTVVRRLPNGNLEVSGDKWITINQGRELVRVSGIVRPYDVQPDNSISSEKVADARIVYSGKGTIADANAQGWLSRFFNMPAFPL
jgi:flagellar L-ring protein precursor FlgH